MAVNTNPFLTTGVSNLVKSITPLISNSIDIIEEKAMLGHNAKVAEKACTCLNKANLSICYLDQWQID